MRSLPVFVSDHTERMVEEAALFYESRQSGLGFRFAKSVQQRYEAISFAPRSFPIWKRSVRFANTKGFPYLILYRVHRLHVDIIAVVHGRSNPRNWL